MSWDNPMREPSDPRDNIIQEAIRAIAHRQAALKAAREAIEWHNIGAFEVNGIAVSDWISDALDSGIRT